MKCKLGSVITDASGCLGGQVVKRSGSSLVLATKRGVRRSDSRRAQISKRFFQIAQNLWCSLIPSSKSLWHSASFDGVSGRNLFIQLNLNYLLYDINGILVPPVFKATAPVLIKSMSINSATRVVSLTFDKQIGLNTSVSLRLSRSVSAGVSSCPSFTVLVGRLRNRSSLSVNFAVPVSVFYYLPFFVGCRVFLKFDTFDILTGIASESNVVSCIVV